MAPEWLLIVVVVALALVVVASAGCVLVALLLAQKRDREVSRHVAAYEELAKQYAHGHAQTADYLLQLVTTQARDDSRLVDKILDTVQTRVVEPAHADEAFDPYRYGDDPDDDRAQDDRADPELRELEQAAEGDSDPGVAAAKRAARADGPPAAEGRRLFAEFAHWAGLAAAPGRMVGRAGGGGLADDGPGDNGSE